MLTFEARLQHGSFALEVRGELPSRGRGVIFGPSGAGKSTLLRIIAGLERGAQARITYNDELWQDTARRLFVPPHRRGVGLIFQQPVFMHGYTVEQVLRYGWRRRGKTACAFDFGGFVERFGLGPFLTRNVDTLSGGERQRVALVRALLAMPQLLLLDEPFSGVDEEARAALLQELEGLQIDLGLPMLYVTHMARETVSFADHLLLLESGRIRAQGPMHTLATDVSLSLARRPDAVVAINTEFVRHDHRDGVSCLRFADGELWVSEGYPHKAGRPRRVLVNARDVSLASEIPHASSILNVLPARVVELAELPDAAVVVSLRIGSTPLLARVSRRSARELELHPGSSVYAQIKGVALLNH